MIKQHTETSKFLSLVLRHAPEKIGISLDSEGWAEIDTLIAAAASVGKRFDRALIESVVDTSDKKRFAISSDGLRIRAVQGHSTTSVDIDYVRKIPPATLYHGTATRFLDAIMKDGLIAGSRHYVHLSQLEETAIAVGTRHGKPVVLTVNAMLMHEHGSEFFQADNGVWLVKTVPAKYLVN